MKTASGHWVTIRGAHVFINDTTGRVSKGPKRMVGMAVRKDAKTHTGRKKTPIKVTFDIKTEMPGKVTYSNKSKTNSAPKFYNKNNYQELYQKEIAKYFVVF